MKKFLSILTVIATVLTLFSCQNSEEPNKTVKKYDRAEQVSENFLEFTTAESETNTDLTENNQTQPSTNPVDSQALRNKYDNFIYYNDSYRTFNGVESTFTPIKLFVDIDGDSLEELIYFCEFYSEDNFAYSFAYFYVFDYIDNQIVEIIGSNKTGRSRLTETFRVYKTDTNYHIVRMLNDGGGSHLATDYVYDGEELIPHRSLYGNYNESVYKISYTEDCFNNTGFHFDEISEEDFNAGWDYMLTRDENIFFTDAEFEFNA